MSLKSVVFFGTAEFAVPSLAILVENKIPVSAVVTAQDKPAGRGQKNSESPVKKFAIEHGLRVLQPVKLKDPEFLETLAGLKPDLQVVVAFRMLPEAVWNLPPLGTINLHASLLPQYRGAAPINWAVINGEAETGVTTFFLKHEIDTGEIIHQAKTHIAHDENATQLHDRLKEIGAELMLKTVRAIEAGEAVSTPQEKIAGIIPLRHAPKLDKSNTRISVDVSPEEFCNLVRGLALYPGAHCELNNAHGIGFSVKIFSSEPVKASHQLKPGTIETDNKKELKVWLRGGYASIRELQLSGRNRMQVRDFLNGVKLEGSWRIN